MSRRRNFKLKIHFSSVVIVVVVVVVVKGVVIIIVVVVIILVAEMNCGNMSAQIAVAEFQQDSYLHCYSVQGRDFVESLSGAGI